eukprot:g29303.t1
MAEIANFDQRGQPPRAAELMDLVESPQSSFRRQCRCVVNLKLEAAPLLSQPSLFGTDATAVRGPERRPRSKQITGCREWSLERKRKRRRHHRSVQSAVLCNARDQRRFLHEMLNGRVLADVLTASIVESCDHSDGLINRLIEACQMDDVRRAFGIYERLRRQRVPLYEGVYKLIIECCIRTHQLGHGIQFYETLKSSGQRVSSRIVIVLIEACAREQHSEKVHALWQPNEPIRPCHRDVFMATLAALVRTMCPDLALELLQDVRHRSGDSTWVLNVEAEVQDLLQLVDTAASEAKHNGEQLGWAALETDLLAQNTDW